jgi:hypothetical protein
VKSGQPVPEVNAIDKRQWKPDEYGLLGPFVNFAHMANSVVTAPGLLQGWFAEPLCRHHSYFPFNARVMENYWSLAFFLGYPAPWNIYYRDPGVRARLELTLRYTFKLLGADGAVPEIDDVPSTLLAGDRMVASGGFGAEALAGTLEWAGEQLSPRLRRELIVNLRKVVTLVLTSKIHMAHAGVVTNQYLGALSAGIRLARRTGDAALRRLVERASDPLLNDLVSPLGYLYESDGADTFGYFMHTTIYRLITAYHAWPVSRFPELLRRHAAWMKRWMLPEPDGQTLVLSTSHMTRTAASWRPVQGAPWDGLGALLAKPRRVERGRAFVGLRARGDDDRRILKLFLTPAADRARQRRAWLAEADPVAAVRSHGYSPSHSFFRLPACHPSEAELSEARARLACRDGAPRVERLDDRRGWTYVFVRRPAYYMGFSFAGHAETTAKDGPAFLWLNGAGTVAVSENDGQHVWQTSSGGATTATMASRVQVAEQGDEASVAADYEAWGVRKKYVLGSRVILVGLSGLGRYHDSSVFTEMIPLLMRDGDEVDVGYGRWKNWSGGKLCCYTRQIVLWRGGRCLLRIEPQTEVQVWFRATRDGGGFARVQMSFPLLPSFYGKFGYRIVLAP